MTKTAATISAVTMLSETYRQPLTDVALQAYVIALDDLDQEAIGMVTKRALRECKFLPTPAELLVLAGKGGPQVLAAEMAEAWTAARWARRVHSYTTGVDFGPLVNAVIRSMGGWLAFCDHNDDVLEAFERKKFETAYTAFRARGEQGDMGRPLSGQFGGVERVAIAGRLPPPRLGAVAEPMADLVRELAEAKAS